MQEKGNLSINSENFLPIIKKWLYTDKDIFIRELVSNACDAVTKLQKLNMMGEADIPTDEKYEIHVVLDQDNKTLKIMDNGIGMTADEIKKYINQIAFSGATDFLQKFQEKGEGENEIIGHFGLGFYSAFMVADKVEIDTLSYQDGAAAAKWLCEGGIDYEMEAGTRETRGTTITLHIGADGEEFLNEATLYEAMTKYCSFMPVPIFVDILKEETEEEKAAAKKAANHVSMEEAMEMMQKEHDAEESTEETEEEPVPMNDTNPLWQKKPSECTDEDYKAFYHKVFDDINDPLFWIHLNMDYPFNLKGILYFPKINTEYDSIEGTIKLYNNQVFIADNIKEVIPEFLMLLKGVIDCPDLPLNVSRSALQNDGFVKKISEYITKKVADKLIGMCKTEKESYEKYWDDISPFIKFGCLKDEKFCDKINDYILFKDINDKYQTLPELLVPVAEEEKTGEETTVEESADAADAKDAAEAADASEEPKEPERTTIYYVTDVNQQGQYIQMFKEQGMNAVILDHNIDTSFITQLEQRNDHYQFMRIDADLTEALKDDSADLTDATATLTEVFKSALNNDKLTVKVEALKNADVASVLTLSEQGRRMQDMMKMYAMGGMGGMDPNMFAADQTLTLNVNNPLVKFILDNKDSEHVPMFAEQLYDLALISNQPLSTEAMTKFVKRSNDIMLLLTK